MDLFNNRELAILFWAIVCLTFVVFSPRLISFRQSIASASKGLFRAFFAPKLSIIYIAMIAHIGGSVYLLSQWDLWNSDQLKNTIVWSLSVAFMALYQMDCIKKDQRYFRHVVLDNLKLIAILEFIIGVYSFPLVVELFLVPVLVIVSLLTAFADRDTQHEQAKDFLNGLTIVVGLTIISYAIYQLFNKPDDFIKEQTFYDFVTPIALTILYLPFVFFVMIYVTYEMVLLRLRFSLPSRKHRWFAVFLGIIIFHVRIQLLERWVSLLQRRDITSYKQIWDTVKQLFFMRRMEKNPPPVPYGHGWSAYEAKDALKLAGLETGLYQEYFGEWSASSPLIDIDDHILSNRIAYYVVGNVAVATQLKLKLYINHTNSAVDAHERFLQAAVVLYGYAVKEEIPVWLADCLLNGKDIQRSYKGNTISLSKEPHLNNAGYEMKFMLSYNDNREDAVAD